AAQHSVIHRRNMRANLRTRGPENTVTDRAVGRVAPALTHRRLLCGRTANQRQIEITRGGDEVAIADRLIPAITLNLHQRAGHRDLAFHFERGSCHWPAIAEMVEAALGG